MKRERPTTFQRIFKIRDQLVDRSCAINEHVGGSCSPDFQSQRLFTVRSFVLGVPYSER